MRSNAFRVFAWACCLSVGVASAGNISFTGTFTQDDQLEIFLFTAPSASFSAETWSYAGGTNGALNVITAGGFDPVLSLFDATGGLSATSPLIATNDDNPLATVDPSTGNAFDSKLTIGTLNAGHTYALVLSVNDNLAYGSTYGDGFTQSGNGNFTAAEFGCSGSGPFCDTGVDQRTGNWAVDINGVRSAVDTSAGGTVPEPGTVLLLSAGLGGVALLRRRRKRV